MFSRTLPCLILLVACRDRPLADYARRDLQGFTVYVSPDAAPHSDAVDASLRVLDQAMTDVRASVTEERLARLEALAFWIEWGRKNHVGGIATYFADELTARNAGFNSKKAQGIVIEHAGAFAKAPAKFAKAVLLHEFSHAYHFQVLGPTNRMITHCYKTAMASGLYFRVPPWDKEQAYAARNQFEYFATLTEAYFGVGVKYPRNMKELAEYDACGAGLMRTLWR